MIKKSLYHFLSHDSIILDPDLNQGL